MNCPKEKDDMKLPKLSNLFKKSWIKPPQIEEIEQHSILLISDLVPTPKRIDFAESDTKISLIDYYKATYLEQIKQDKTITTVDLLSKDMQTSKDMYLNLLINLCLKDTSDISFSCVTDIGNKDLEYLDAQIIYTKLKLYINRVISLKEEAALRLVALNEILDYLKSGKLFTKLKFHHIIDTIELEICNLKIAYFTFTTQETAMLKETEAYLKEMQNIISSEDIELKNEEAINKRLEEAKRMLKLVDIEYLERLESLDLSPILLIASIEQYLEIYVYKNREKIDEINKELQKIEKQVSGDIIMYFFEGEDALLIKKDRYLQSVLKLETQFKLFGTYGRNLVSKEQLKTLYEMKFILLTCDVSKISDTRDFNILEGATFTELEIYQDFIFKKIEYILKGEHNLVKKLSSNGDKKVIVGYIKAVILNGKKEFNTFSILNDHKVLSFILSFNSLADLKEFYKKTKVPKSEYSEVDFYEDYVEWEEDLPLDTIYRIKKCNKNTKDTLMQDDDPLFSLYLMCGPLMYPTNSASYSLPEGLTKIDESAADYIHDLELSKMQEYLKSLCLKKIIIMPSSLKEISGNPFYTMQIENAVLNDNLKILDEYALLIPELKEITLYNGINRISSKALVPKKLKIITIKTDKSTIEDAILQLLLSCYEASKTKKVRYYQPTKRDEEKQKLYDEGRYTSSDNLFLYAREAIYTTYALTPTFNVLILKSDDEDSKILSKQELTFEYERSNLVYISDDKKQEDSALTSLEATFISNELKTIFASLYPDQKETKEDKSYN